MCIYIHLANKATTSALHKNTVTQPGHEGPSTWAPIAGISALVVGLAIVAVRHRVHERNSRAQGKESVDEQTPLVVALS